MSLKFSPRRLRLFDFNKSLQCKTDVKTEEMKSSVQNFVLQRKEDFKSKEEALHDFVLYKISFF